MTYPAQQLAEAGCIAPLEEAAELVDAAAGDAELLERLVACRVGGEPLAWVVGSTVFAGVRVCIHPGVYVPRWQTEALARAGPCCSSWAAIRTRPSEPCSATPPADRTYVR